MIFAGIIAELRSRLAKRREYRRLADEILSLSNNDIAELGGDRGEMLFQVHRQVYGR